VLKTLDAFDWDAGHGLDRDDVLELFDLSFVEERRNVVLIGGVGTGKTHLATALAIAACQRGLRVRFLTAAELTTALVEAKAQDRLSRKIEHFARFDMIVLDEVGYVPFDRVGADLLFSFISRVYERRSVVVTTNLPFGRWSEVFHDTTAAAAVIDRIVHHATVLKTDGESYRLKDAKGRGRKRRKEAHPG
jgi:DNA replication protein DnaC